MKRSFRMITLKQILPQICPGDWFMSLDLKDVYFHIQVAPHRRLFLRFAFEGVAYQYKVLLFGLSLAPCPFTRWMDAALSPLRQMEIRILNYLDNGLILAQSQAVFTSHKTLLLSHLDCQGLRVNFAKTILSPSQHVPEHSYRLIWQSAYDSNCLSVTVTWTCVSALAHWRDPFRLKRGVILDTAHKRKVVTTEASNKGWGALCEGKPTFGRWSEEESILPAGHSGTPCANMLRQQVRGVIHKSPGRPRLEVTLHAGEQPSFVGSEQSALTGGDACAGQNKPRSRHVVKEQCLFKGMDAPPARGSENLGNLWQGSSRPLRLQRQLSLPNLFYKEHEWPRLPLYAFPPVALLPQILRWVREQQHKLILIALLWRNQPWVSELFQLLKAAPWPVPLRWDLLSQANGTIWHPRPELWALHVWPLDGSLSSSQSVS